MMTSPSCRGRLEGFCAGTQPVGLSIAIERRNVMCGIPPSDRYACSASATSSTSVMLGRAAQPLELLVGLDESQPLELAGHVDDLAEAIAKRQVVRVRHPHIERRVDTDEPDSARRSQPFC